MNTITGILLAAGRSQRMGQSKLLLPWHGVPLVRHVAATALRSHMDELVVIVGHRAAHVAAALDGLPVKIVQNPDFVDGQSTSLRVGVAAAQQSEAIVVLLADQPLLQSATIDAMIDVYCRDRPVIVAPRYKGQRGTPVLWDRSLFGALQTIGGDQGARGVLHEHRERIRWLDVSDSGVTVDIDTPDAYTRVLEASSTLLT